MEAQKSLMKVTVLSKWEHVGFHCLHFSLGDNGHVTLQKLIKLNMALQPLVSGALDCFFLLLLSQTP